MNRFWNNILYPIIHKLNLNFIVEIGSDYGVNTKNILDYCLKNDKKMVAIDPNPKFNLEEFSKNYGNKFNLYDDISLKVLPTLKDYDCVLIDGDHNWYTVYNELKIIESNEKDNFPLIFLHDISWPYGRRDLYYDPSQIPDEYLNPYKMQAISIETDELDSKGLNGHLNNAIKSNTNQNGVLTAIEDFMKQSELNLKLIKIDAFHGLGILYVYEKNVDKIINDVVHNSNMSAILEKNYLTNIISLKNNVSSLKDEIGSLKREINFLESNLDEKDNLIDNKIKEITELNNINNNLEKDIQEKSNEIEIQTKEITELNNINNDLENDIREKSNEIKNNIHELALLKIENNTLHDINSKNVKLIFDKDIEIKE